MRIGGRRVEDVLWEVEVEDRRRGGGRRKKKEGEKKREEEEEEARCKSLGVGKTTRSRIIGAKKKHENERKKN